jgi:hypothetical protein
MPSVAVASQHAFPGNSFRGSPRPAELEHDANAWVGAPVTFTRRGPRAITLSTELGSPEHGDRLRDFAAWRWPDARARVVVDRAGTFLYVEGEGVRT